MSSSGALPRCHPSVAGGAPPGETQRQQRAPVCPLASAPTLFQRGKPGWVSGSGCGEWRPITQDWLARPGDMVSRLR